MSRLSKITSGHESLPRRQHTMDRFVTRDSVTPARAAVAPRKNIAGKVIDDDKLIDKNRGKAKKGGFVSLSGLCKPGQQALFKICGGKVTMCVDSSDSAQKELAAQSGVTVDSVRFPPYFYEILLGRVNVRKPAELAKVKERMYGSGRAYFGYPHNAVYLRAEDGSIMPLENERFLHPLLGRVVWFCDGTYWELDEDGHRTRNRAGRAASGEGGESDVSGGGSGADAGAAGPGVGGSGRVGVRADEGAVSGPV